MRRNFNTKHTVAWELAERKRLMEKSGRRRSKARQSLVMATASAECEAAMTETQKLNMDMSRMGEEWMGPNAALQRLRDKKQAQRDEIDAQRQMTMEVITLTPQLCHLTSTLYLEF